MSKLLFGIVLALMLTPVALAQAVNAPFVHPMQAPVAPRELRVPEPADLQPDWWQYFETTSDKELEQRTVSAIERLDKTVNRLPEAVAGAAAQFAERIRGNLQALPQARNRAGPSSPAAPSIAERYSIPQLLEIAWRQRTLQAKVQADRDEAAAAKADVQAAHRRIDTLMAAYLSHDAEDPERALRGLEIMADRSAVALAEEQLRLIGEALKAAEGRLQHSVEEGAAAAVRLIAGKADLTRLDSEIEQVGAALAKAREALDTAQARAAQARAAGMVSTDPEAEATALYRLQQARRAAVFEGIARMRLGMLQVQGLLAMLLAAPEDLDAKALRARLAALTGDLDELRRQAATWRRDSARERDRAGEAVARAAGAGSEETLTFMRLLNQHRLEHAQETLVALQSLEELGGMAALLTQQVEDQLARREGWLHDWLARTGQVLDEVWGRAVEWANLSLFKLAGTPVTALGLLRVALIIFIAWLASHWLRQGLRRFAQRAEGVNQAAFYTVERVSHYALIAIGVIVGLSSIGLDFTNFALVAGAIGIGIGFGTQSIVKNFLAGLVLLFERNLKVGDFVELASGVAGEVRAINVRSTVVNTNDNVDIVVPNSQFVDSDVINWTLVENYRRIHVPFRVAYGTDKELVKKAALEAAEGLACTMQTRKPAVWLVDFADNGLEFELVVWIVHEAVKRPGAVDAAYKWEIESALQRYGIEVPVPQRDLRLRYGFGALRRMLRVKKGPDKVYPLR